MEEIMHCVVDIGEEMLRSGAEVRRVEDSMERMFAAYGARRSDVLAIASGIHVTVVTGQGHTLTQTRRVRTVSNNYGKVDALNALSRAVCEGKPEAAEIRTRLSAITDAKRESPVWRFLGGILGAAAFAVFFGGTVADGLIAALISLPYTASELWLRRPDMNPVVYNFVWSLIMGLLAQGAVAAGIGGHADMIMIGCIMLPIPGALVTASLRDMLRVAAILKGKKVSDSISLSISSN
jgi:uncharacterized membrane protein YjjP (DUF1212 family)